MTTTMADEVDYESVLESALEEQLEQYDDQEEEEEEEEDEDGQGDTVEYLTCSGEAQSQYSEATLKYRHKRCKHYLWILIP